MTENLENKKTALIFPGQGSQHCGMAKDFFDNFAYVKHQFEEADDILGFSLSKIIFGDDEELLRMTSNTQSALMLASRSVLLALEKEAGLTTVKLCEIVAGHSLGEYSALEAAGALSFEDTLKLLHKRGKFMQESASSTPGAMAACIKISVDEIQKIIKEYKDANQDAICQIANDNVAGQIVISGDKESITAVAQNIRDAGYRAIELKVAGAFHSELMKDAQDQMAKEIEQVQISPPARPIICNVDARATVNPDKIKQNLSTQICSMVRWRESMNQMAKMGVARTIEVGAGSTLTGIAKRSGLDFESFAISDLQSMAEYIKNV